jgi:Zn-dependent membrane protease YugP
MWCVSIAPRGLFVAYAAVMAPGGHYLKEGHRSRVSDGAPALNRLKEGIIMSLLTAIILIIAVILLITGGIVQSLNFLLWVGLVLLAIAVITFLLRSISGRK